MRLAIRGVRERKPAGVVPVHEDVEENVQFLAGEAEFVLMLQQKVRHRGKAG
jgi:hypothetical protein